MRIFSPSDTEAYLLCSRRREYEKRLKPRANHWEPSQLLGTAIHAGMAAYYGTKRKTPDLELTFEAVEGVAYRALEAGFVEQGEWTLDGLKMLTTRGLKQGLGPKMDVLGPDGTVVGVELALGECRIDLVTRHPEGLAVTDWKVAVDLDKKYEPSRLAEMEHKWQLHHYAWRVSTFYGEPVDRAQVGLIVLGPRAHAVLHPVRFDAARLANWLKSAETVWADMEAEREGRRLPVMNTRNCHVFNRPCPFYALCHDFAGDEDRAAAFYTTREGGEE